MVPLIARMPKPAGTEQPGLSTRQYLICTFLLAHPPFCPAWSISIAPSDVPFSNLFLSCFLPCRACLEYLRQSGRQPDVVHCHEWQASTVPMLFWETEFHQVGRRERDGKGGGGGQ